MDAVAEQRRIRELESLRRSARYLRILFFLAVLGIVGWCLYRLHKSVTALAYAGPEQDTYMKSLQVNLDKDVIPRMRAAASETLTEVQPEVTIAVKKLGTRLPEVTAVAKKEMEALQTDLPNKGEAILNASFKTMVERQEPQIRSSYPDLSNDQLATLVKSLEDEGQKQLIAANNELFSPHQAKLKNILENLQKIKTEEAANVKKVQPSWDMAILLLDILREDLKTRQGEAQADTSASSPDSLPAEPSKPTAAKSPAAKPAGPKPAPANKTVTK